MANYYNKSKSDEKDDQFFHCSKIEDEIRKLYQAGTLDRILNGVDTAPTFAVPKLYDEPARRDWSESTQAMDVTRPQTSVNFDDDIDDFSSFNLTKDQVAPLLNKPCDEFMDDSEVDNDSLLAMVSAAEKELESNSKKASPPVTRGFKKGSMFGKMKKRSMKL